MKLSPFYSWLSRKGSSWMFRFPWVTWCGGLLLSWAHPPLLTCFNFFHLSSLILSHYKYIQVLHPLPTFHLISIMLLYLGNFRTSTPTPTRSVFVTFQVLFEDIKPVLITEWWVMNVFFCFPVWNLYRKIFLGISEIYLLKYVSIGYLLSLMSIM